MKNANSAGGCNDLNKYSLVSWSIEIASAEYGVRHEALYNEFVYTA